ncbi:30S ribosomal protein S12 methylthiotransferase accessory factor YcaO [Thiolinea disciformis]|uniref:30S ribosomal protein S12 methylthiotransferase accessory factor YcaO n=1 Tax=Thiolinea disciformis TaxID=125614 RepID=UPI00036A84C1|nr:30S ribosomal protein S12 methylthiotransferase accessory factor YcaO [Thiolinea disciformis]
MTESFIPGKDASLESSIANLQKKLAALGFNIVERSWLNPIANVWSVHIADRDCPLLFTNGKGGSEKACLASALGEFFERLSTNYFWADYYLGADIANGPFVHYPAERWFPASDKKALAKEALSTELRTFYDPEKSMSAADWVDINSGNAERGVCTLPYVRQRDGKTVYFPVNLIGNLYVSNGMSAGNTATEARTQALSEIFERHIKFRIIAEGICLPDVPEQVLARYPKIISGINELRDSGFGIQIKDASLGGRYPVMCVTLLNPNDQGVYASFGAHPRFEVALERALTELLQGRALDKLAGFPEPSVDLEEVAEPHNLETHFIDSSGPIHWNFLRSTPDYAFVDWNAAGTTSEEFNWLCERIHEEDCDIYIMDYEHLGVYACRILVPGMSEIYLPEDLQWDNNNVGNWVREPILNLLDLDDEEYADLLESLNELGLDDAQPIAALIGLAPDADSIWADLRVGELKGLLAMKLGAEEQILESCQWMRLFEQGNAERNKVYRCVEALLNLDNPSDYKLSLDELYGSRVLSVAHQLLSGNLSAIGLDSPTLTLEGCKLHQSLLAAYRKVHPELAA